VGRKRAAFREGIGEEERDYAQALRDIRDLRGETQQELGSLLGWSVSIISRFEAATERPDRATHQRYCALAPTEELRRRAAAAYAALPPDSNARHPRVVRRSPEGWHGHALDGPGVYQLLEASYPTYPPVGEGGPPTAASRVTAAATAPPSPRTGVAVTLSNENAPSRSRACQHPNPAP
jgi:transcriptional regulator with XRE-family HTH domain